MAQVRDIPNNSILEHRIYTSIANQVFMNVLHFKLTAELLETSPGAVCQGMNTKLWLSPTPKYKAEYLNCLASNALVTKVCSQIVYPTRYVGVYSNLGFNGTRGSGCDALNVSAVITKKGPEGNRWNIGSMHIPCVPMDAYAQGTLTTDYVTDMDLLIAALDDVINLPEGNTDWEPAILNKEPIPNTDPVRYRISGATIIDTWQSQNTLRVMRRRTVGLGI